MSFCLILLAAGNSGRFKSNIAKPYHKIGGKTLAEISLKKASFEESKTFKSKNVENFIKKNFKNL